MPASLDIRRLIPADASIYREFRLRGLRDHPDAFTSSFEEEAMRPLVVTQQRLAADSETSMWGAFIDDVLAGAIGLSRESRRKNRHKASVVAMYVPPEFSSRGIGRALIAEVIAHARAAGMEQLTLTVTASNARARALYAGAGFASFGVEPRAIKVDGVYYAKEHMILLL